LAWPQHVEAEPARHHEQNERMIVRAPSPLFSRIVAAPRSEAVSAAAAITVFVLIAVQLAAKQVRGSLAYDAGVPGETTRCASGELRGDPDCAAMKPAIRSAR
jgi:hypothetical protein